MENLIEPLQITEEILNKLGHDFIRRYQLKESINSTHLRNDTHFLVEQLRLYSRSISQIKAVNKANSALFDLKFNEVVFKVLQCLAKVIEKLIKKCGQLETAPRYEQSVCDLCGTNLNSKKIKNLQKQIFDYFPILEREELVQKDSFQHYSAPLDNDMTNEELIQKKMLTLQRNLQDRQSGLLRSIEQFQSFRNDLIIGLPRLNAQDGYDKFNVKQHAFQMGIYFHNSLKQIETKIALLRTVARKTAEQSVQCCMDDAQLTDKTTSQLDNAKLSSLRAEGQVKKLAEIKGKLQDVIRSQQIEVVSLKDQLNELQEKNIVLKEQYYLEKIKKVPRERHNKPILLTPEDKPRKLDSPVPPETPTLPPPPAQNDVMNEISNQIAEMRSELESSGTKMEDVIPLIKSSVRKAIDHFMGHRMSTILDRKRLQFDTNEEDSVASNSKNKINPASFKRVSNFYHKRDAKANHSNHELSTEFSISTQFNYKIHHAHKPSINRISMLDERLLEGFDLKQKKAGISIYKKSVLQTEGNVKAKRLKTTLSSVSSELKQNMSVHEQSSVFKNQKLHEMSQFYRESNPKLLHRESNAGSIGRNAREYIARNVSGHLQGSIIGNMVGTIGGNIDGLFLGDSPMGELMETKTAKLNPHRKKKKNISCQDLQSLCRKQELRLENDKNLIQIKGISGKTIPNDLILAFLQPSPRQEDQPDVQRAKKEHKTEQIQKKQKKENKRHMTKVANTPKNGKLKAIVTLKLDQISFLTYFFTLMARAHVSNPRLYEQLRQEILCPQNDPQLQQSQENMLRNLVGELIIQHRRCREAKDNKLCQHLCQFIQAFQSCVN